LYASGTDVDIELGEGAGDVVEHTHSIDGIYVDHRRRVRCRVVEPNLGNRRTPDTVLLVAVRQTLGITRRDDMLATGVVISAVTNAVTKLLGR